MSLKINPEMLEPCDLGGGVMINVGGKIYANMKDAFLDYLKIHNCTTCNHVNSCRTHDRGMVCLQWTKVVCEHKFVNVRGSIVMNDAPNTIHFKCTKCGKIVYYKKVEGELYG